MIIKGIKIKNFRNYHDLELLFNGSRNVLIGANAQGKTNLIESIYICAFSKSFRTNNAADMVRIGSERASVTITAERDDIEKEISIIINKSGKKMIKKDGKMIKRVGELLNNLVVVIFSPEDLRIIKDSPVKRRNFIDREMSQIKPHYHECIKNYNEALKQKNTMLKYRQRDLDLEMLDVYDMQLAKYGSKIVSYRSDFVEMLSERANLIQNSISGGREDLEISYSKSQDSDGFYEALLKNRERDIYSGFSVIGPHRDDLDFYINGLDAKKYGSQGQQRTIALALKLAEIQIVRDLIGENPVLLLDDVLSELDYERQKFLFNEIDDVQIFVTAADLNEDLAKNMLNGTIFNVENGVIKEKRGNFDV